ncbi:MAG: hypothetical protein HY708_06195 [Ignavibacteriae bacterium]|nr:hypothetical protein [Ignavibacteriota bacterium]
MGIYPQPNKWQCGPFALKHALIMLGKFVDEKQVSRLAGTHWWAGTDEIKLARAARAYDCEMKVIRRKNALRAKRELLATLKRGYPAVLCVDDWGHWITVVGVERGKFIYLDSREAPVVCIDTWTGLKNRWVFKEPDEDDPTNTETLFDLHPVIPRLRPRTKARFSLKRARYLRRAENRKFATHWDEYFSDLTHICQPRTPQSERVFPMGALLRRHGSMIKTQVAFWHGVVTREQVGKILKNLQFVADTYDLVIREEDEKHAIVAITANLSLWAASKFGVNEVYGEGADT